MCKNKIKTLIFVSAVFVATVVALISVIVHLGQNKNQSAQLTQSYTQTLVLKNNTIEFSKKYAELCKTIPEDKALQLLCTFDYENIEKIISAGYSDDILSMAQLSYFNIENLERYINFLNQNPQKTPEETVIYVNNNLDTPFYENPKTIVSPDSYEVLVNKYNVLDSYYKPDNLVKIPAAYAKNNNQYMEAVAADAFVLMVKAARKDGINIEAASTYRTYYHQKLLYNDYTENHGKAWADLASARPGYSEHHTGLAVDIKTPYAFVSENSKAYEWLCANCAKYGFILRYPKDKTDITGYKFEPWHYRYIGITKAKEIMSQNITYEEYIEINTDYNYQKPDISNYISEISEYCRQNSEQTAARLLGLTQNQLSLLLACSY